MNKYVAWVLVLAVLQRIAFFAWGLYQDAHMEPLFTDIDYFVFTDAAQFVNMGMSPYARETYRYTPLLAWLLLPTQTWFFSFGKCLFALGDIVAGLLAIDTLRINGVPPKRAALYSSVWLLNPMVSAISTRGSSEGLLGAIVMSMLWAVSARRYVLAGLCAGLSVHFKIYPVIYMSTLIWGMPGPRNFVLPSFYTRDRLVLAVWTIASFALLTGGFYYVYGYEFLHHAYLHHLSRIDHRHNFSPYSLLLYMAPLEDSTVGKFLSVDSTLGSSLLHPETWSFIPQLGLSAIVIPFVFAKTSIAKSMFLQTFVFVTFNKVCTSQYFMWYMVLLPFFLGSMANVSRARLAITGALWVLAQVWWIRQGYLLEFLGLSTFYPGLFAATLIFFAVNCGAVGLFLDCL